MKIDNLGRAIKIAVIVSFLGVLSLPGRTQQLTQQYEFLNFADVNITDDFWKPKIDKVATVTLNACIDQTEFKTPRIQNFINVAKKNGVKHQGIYYDDSDVYKAIEAMAYSIKNDHDPKLEAKADEWIDWIAAAQLPDGYLNTYYTLNGLDKRWTDVEKHEDYNAGHLIEAAVAYFDATGKKKFLNVAIRFANHIDSTFRLANRPWFSGHQEIELALVKLYKTTNDTNYLKLADWYLQQRGHSNQVYNYAKSWITPDYWQSAVPVYDQTQITGHAVRAMYMYTGAADVGALTGNEKYMKAMEKVWQDVVFRNMYVTGGIGAAGKNEGFTVDYDLPNESAYCETCASVGMVFWNQRMAQLTGSSTYVDVLEKSLYNAALDGLSLNGDRFFYDNPLASLGHQERRAWFGTACCPANISRLVASIGNYIYAKSSDGLWVNLFVGSKAKTSVNQQDLEIETKTGYPWSDKVQMNFDVKQPVQFTLHLRVPGWFTGKASPGNLYRFTNYQRKKTTVTINGKSFNGDIKNGYLDINRVWKNGDLVEYTLPMQALKIAASDSVTVDVNKIALQFGPIIYCIEDADNNNDVWNLIVSPNATFLPKKDTVLNEKVIALVGTASKIVPSASGMQIMFTPKPIKAIPYYTWANRGEGNMQVWLSTKIKNVKINSD